MPRGQILVRRDFPASNGRQPGCSRPRGNLPGTPPCPHADTDCHEHGQSFAESRPWLRGAGCGGLPMADRPAARYANALYQHRDGGAGEPRNRWPTRTGAPPLRSAGRPLPADSQRMGGPAPPGRRPRRLQSPRAAKTQATNRPAGDGTGREVGSLRASWRGPTHRSRFAFGEAKLPIGIAAGEWRKKGYVRCRGPRAGDRTEREAGRYC